MTGSVQRPPRLLLDVWPNETSGDLAPRYAVPEEFRRRADEIADSIGEVAVRFRNRLSKLIRRPDGETWGVESVEIEFGIKVTAETGVLIAKASGGATFTARLKLQVKSDEP
jgi:hypothetical protein